MRATKTQTRDVEKFDVSHIYVEQGDCFGTYLGTDNACLSCHDSHACAFLKQKKVFDLAKTKEPAVSIGRDGLIDMDEVASFLGKSVIESLSILRGRYPHLSEQVLSVTIKKTVLQRGWCIKGGVICE